MAPGVLLAVWVWNMAVGASEWGSLYFEVLLRPDDGGSVAHQPFKGGENHRMWPECMQVHTTLSKTLCSCQSIIKAHVSTLLKIITPVFCLFSWSKQVVKGGGAAGGGFSVLIACLFKSLPSGEEST